MLVVVYGVRNSGASEVAGDVISTNWCLSMKLEVKSYALENIYCRLEVICVCGLSGFGFITEV